MSSSRPPPRAIRSSSHRHAKLATSRTPTSPNHTGLTSPRLGHASRTVSRLGATTYRPTPVTTSPTTRVPQRTAAVATVTPPAAGRCRVTSVGRTTSSRPARPGRGGGPPRPGRVRPARRGSAREPSRCAAALPAPAGGPGRGCWTPRRAGARRRPGPAAGSAARATTPTPAPRATPPRRGQHDLPALDDLDHLDDSRGRELLDGVGDATHVVARPATGPAGRRRGAAGRTRRPRPAAPARRPRAACSSRRPRA